MTPTAERLRESKPQIEAIAREFGVSNVRVFGSVARGDSRDGSDVDLLIQIDPDRSLLDLIGFEDEVSAVMGCPIDVVTERALRPRLAPTILREARPL